MTKERMRLGELFNWLVDEEGLTRRHVQTLVHTKKIKGKPFPGDKRCYYYRSQVERDVLQPAALTN